MELKRLIKDYQLDADELAALLFPRNKYPVLALKRVLIGKAFLSSPQISKLARYIGVSIDDLFTTESWRSVSTGHVLTFYKDDYIARLDTRTWITQILHKDSLYHEGIIHGPNTPLSTYIYSLNKIIKDVRS